MSKKYIIGLDAGTTSVRTVLFDVIENKIIDIDKIKFKQQFQKSGWVEQDANEIWSNLNKTLNTIIKNNNLSANDVYGIGLTNQRESVVAWNKTTGESICPSIVWQCRRTAEFCRSIKPKVVKNIKKRTGLIVDAYFSASKIKWILENNKKAQKLLLNNNLCVGTLDSFITYKLSKGNSFITDTSNASRTMLFNIHSLLWDKYLLKKFNVPEKILPKVVSNGEILAYAKLEIGEIPIASILGDQEASLFGQGCFEVGNTKNTYGTGCFILSNTGEHPIENPKLLTTIAWTINNLTTYATEGSVFNAGSALDWAVEEMNWAENSINSSNICLSVSDTDGVYIVPAFTGIGAPYWDQFARGVITGLTRNTTKAHLMRAVIESMAFNSFDIISNMAKTEVKIKELTVDGGVSKNDFLMQFQADISNIKITRLNTSESTVLGVIYMACLSLKIYKDISELKPKIQKAITFNPKMNEKQRQEKLKGWHNAVEKTLYKNIV